MGLISAKSQTVASLQADDTLPRLTLLFVTIISDFTPRKHDYVERAPAVAIFNSPRHLVAMPMQNSHRHRDPVYAATVELDNTPRPRAAPCGP